jgi:hypothetical protein
MVLNAPSLRFVVVYVPGFIVMDVEPRALLIVEPRARGISITIGPVSFVRKAISSCVLLFFVSNSVVPVGAGLLKFRGSLVTPNVISRQDKPIFLQPCDFIPISPERYIQTPTVHGSAAVGRYDFACSWNRFKRMKENRVRVFIVFYLVLKINRIERVQYFPTVPCIPNVF